jgi:transposase-like protein
MNIIERGLAFVQWLLSLSQRSAWDWKRCPKCGSTVTCKWGRYARYPWFLAGRERVWVQRHRCKACPKTYSEQSALLVRGSWYAREVHRCAIDHWQ